MIISRTPLRVSFVGGGTDLKTFYEVEPGEIIGTTINKYIYIAVNRPLDKTIKVSYWKTEIVDSIDQVEHSIVRETLKFMGLTNNVEIVSIPDIPPGTGLGSSGSFTVGLLNALYAYKSVFVSREQLTKDACFIEVELLGAPIGKQDQYLAAYGGLQYIQFNPDGSVFVEPIPCPSDVKKELESNLMLFYTGQSRDAGSILAKQQAKSKEPPTFELLKGVKGLTGEMRKILTEGGDLRRFGELLHMEWMYKKRLVEGISNRRIDEYYERALAAGAIGGKISGAGGGGFLLLYCENKNRQEVREALSDLKEVEFLFDSQGSTIISVG